MIPKAILSFFCFKRISILFYCVAFFQNPYAAYFFLPPDGVQDPGTAALGGRARPPLSSGSLLGAWHAALQPCVADLFGPLGYAPTAEQRALCAELLRRAPDAQTSPALFLWPAERELP